MLSRKPFSLPCSQMCSAAPVAATFAHLLHARPRCTRPVLGSFFPSPRFFLSKIHIGISSKCFCRRAASPGLMIRVRINLVLRVPDPGFFSCVFFPFSSLRGFFERSRAGTPQPTTRVFRFHAKPPSAVIALPLSPSRWWTLFACLPLPPLRFPKSTSFAADLPLFCSFFYPKRRVVSAKFALFPVLDPHDMFFWLTPDIARVDFCCAFFFCYSVFLSFVFSFVPCFEYHVLFSRR